MGKSQLLESYFNASPGGIIVGSFYPGHLANWLSQHPGETGPNKCVMSLFDGVS